MLERVQTYLRPKPDIAFYDRGFGIYPPTYDDLGESRLYPKKLTPFDEETRTMVGGRIVTGETTIVKPLTFGSVEEIRLLKKYDDGAEQGLERYIRTNIQGLDTPVYIFDDHNHALFAWAEAQNESRIDPLATLVHFDSHADNVEPQTIRRTDPQPSLEDLAKVVHFKIDIESFIAPALSWQIAREMIWVNPDWVGGVIDVPPGIQTINLGQIEAVKIPHQLTNIWHISKMFSGEVDKRGLIVDIDLDFFDNIRADSYTAQIYLKLMQNIMKKAGVVTIATSPGYIDQPKALSLVKRLGLE